MPLETSASERRTSTKNLFNQISIAVCQSLCIRKERYSAFCRSVFSACNKIITAVYAEYSSKKENKVACKSVFCIMTSTGEVQPALDVAFHVVWSWCHSLQVAYQRTALS